MTQLLEKAIARLQKLSASDQDTIAALIFAEIADDERWDESFARSQLQLSRVADKVRDDIRAGRTRKAGIDEL